jgi:hypothetical protein
MASNLSREEKIRAILQEEAIRQQSEKLLPEEQFEFSLGDLKDDLLETDRLLLEHEINCRSDDEG